MSENTKAFLEDPGAPSGSVGCVHLFFSNDFCHTVKGLSVMSLCKIIEEICLARRVYIETGISLSCRSGLSMVK
ncbi:hypothetical protein TNCV_1669791, partial [Trichonephila clavipes]